MLQVRCVCAVQPRAAHAQVPAPGLRHHRRVDAQVIPERARLQTGGVQ